MKRPRVLLILVLATALTIPSAAAADEPLAQIKRLYFAAQYEEALAALAHAAPEESDEAGEYVVLCYLGLGRTSEAEQVIERLVLKNPLHPLDLKGRSPKFVAAYQPVRQRLIAIVAETMYGLAKASFRSGQRGVASSRFKDLIVLLEGSDADTPRIADLRMLAEGFVSLAEPRPIISDRPTASRNDIPIQETLAMTIVADIETAASREGAVDTRPFSPWRPQVFSVDDSNVKPPVVVDQRMPTWNAPRQFAHSTFRGSLEVLIGEDGLVASVRSLSRTHPMYDQILVAAAKSWAYEPAVKDGRPVKYRKVVDFTLRGQ